MQSKEELYDSKSRNDKNYSLTEKNFRKIKTESNSNQQEDKYIDRLIGEY